MGQLQQGKSSRISHRHCISMVIRHYTGRLDCFYGYFNAARLGGSGEKAAGLNHCNETLSGRLPAFLFLSAHPAASGFYGSI